MKTVLPRLAVIIFATVLGILLLAFLGQRRLIYFPEKETPETSLRRAERLGLESWRSSSGALLGWWAPHPSGVAAGRLLVFHGNAGSALDRSHFIKAFQSPSVIPPLDIYLLEYPGYGSLEGSPSERALLKAALAGVDSLPGKPLVICGESLGGALACLTAAQRPQAVQGLILMVPMKNLTEIGKRHYPMLPSFLLRDRFRADLALAVFKGPASFLIAGQDEVVFTDLSLALRNAHIGPHRTWIEPSASHNGLARDPALPRWAEMAAFALDSK